MPLVLVAKWEGNVRAPGLEEVTYGIVPRIGDLIEFAREDGRASTYRVFEVILVPGTDEPVKAEVQVELMSHVNAQAYVQDLR